ncbi:hypothetical protein EDC04DRAFT_2616010 [Pisolithus marmoratus]|nr:hypothetical protein EDC04DRAFT_2616010 [Pisolithus marmoratus]
MAEINNKISPEQQHYNFMLVYQGTLLDHWGTSNTMQLSNQQVTDMAPAIMTALNISLAEDTTDMEPGRTEGGGSTNMNLTDHGIKRIPLHPWGLRGEELAPTLNMR